MRTHVLLLIAIVSLAVAEFPAAQATPKYTFVLVHGAWAGGWEWKKVGEQLLQHGRTVYRPTHTGQGERRHLASPDIDLDTHITVVNVILFDSLPRAAFG